VDDIAEDVADCRTAGSDGNAERYRQQHQNQSVFNHRLPTISGLAFVRVELDHDAILVTFAPRSLADQRAQTD
jgi:hypothetical protein